MAKKQIKLVERMLPAWLMLAGLFFLFAPQSLTGKLQFAFVRIFHRPLSICRSFALFTLRPQSSESDVSRSEYIRLRNHLINNLQLLRQERQKVEKLSGLRDRFAWEGVNFVLADIITFFRDGSRSEFIINRGKDDGLARDQFVLGRHSIVGTISDLGSRIARVRSVMDPKSRIAVRVAELDVACMMQGNGNSSARIRLLPIKYKIKIGDIVYVRKSPGFLGTPIIAGTVSRYERDDENPLFWDITVKPACNIQSLNSVAIVIMNPHGQQVDMPQVPPYMGLSQPVSSKVAGKKIMYFKN